MEAVREQSGSALDPRWERYVVGTGMLKETGAVLRLATVDAQANEYSNAQIDDYRALPRRCFLWRPPVKLTVRARFSATADQLRGTAGFGFWNDPFLMTGARVPAFPRAVWFFYASPPSDMKLDVQAPGCGWKAATIDALRPAAWAWIPVAPLAVLLMNVRPIYRALWPTIQRSLRVREVTVAVDMTQWHTYRLEWCVEQVRFSVAADDNSPPMPIMDAPSPGGPLGFVMWIDNQYLVITPWGRLRWGLLDAPGYQWMDVDRLAIEPLKGGRHG